MEVTIEELNVKVNSEAVSALALPPWLIPLLLELLKRFLESRAAGDVSDTP